MLRNLPVFFRIFLLVLLGATTSIVDAHADASSQPSNAIGYDVDLADLPSPHPRPEKLPAAEGDVSPIFVRIRVPWKLIEKVRGVNDWTVLDRLVADHADAGFAVILEPHGRNPLYDDPGEIAAAWSAFLGALGDRYKHQVRAYIVGRDIQDAPLREAAFWLKTTSVRIHSVDPDALVATLLDLTRQGALDRLTSLYKEGLAVYVDAIAVRGLGTAGGEDLLAKVKNVMILSDPSATVWWVDAAVPGGLVNAGLLLRSYMTGLAQELDLSLFRLDWDEDGRPALLPVLLRIRETFRPAHSSLTASARGIRAVTPMGEPLPVKTLRLYDPDLKQVLILYDGGEGATRGMQAVLQIDTVDIAKPVLRDVAAGESAPVSAYRRNERTGITGVALPIADYPLVLEYKRFTSRGGKARSHRETLAVGERDHRGVPGLSSGAGRPSHQSAR
ncbi:MAG: hypothetical protein ACE5HU_00410 [Acidobacteriota bacterium]